MIRPLKSKNNFIFISHILNKDILYYIFLLMFLKKLVFPLRLFYKLNSIFIYLYNSFKIKFIEFYFLITKVWHFLDKLDLAYINLFKEVFFQEKKFHLKYKYTPLAILNTKEYLLFTLFIKRRMLHLRISAKNRGYSKIIEIKKRSISRKQEKIFNLNLRYKFFLIKYYLKDELFLKKESFAKTKYVNSLINKKSLKEYFRNIFYIIVRFFTPLICVGVIKRNLLKKTRSYYLAPFSRNMHVLLLLRLHNFIKLKNNLPKLQQARAIRLKKRLKKLFLFNTIIFIYKSIKLWCRHGFYTFNFLIGILTFINILDIYFSFRYL